MLPIKFHPEVKDALDQGKAVVALESTIITHGMPWPQNVDVAIAVENIVRKAGAVPATIAVFDRSIQIGLNNQQLAFLGQAKDVMKLSRADLAFALAAGRIGATTVAATMIAASLAGIEVFATGGIGGVHKGAENTFDISADLTELARTNTIVVSAGPKAILDGEKTIEFLETRGSSGCNLPIRYASGILVEKKPNSIAITAGYGQRNSGFCQNATKNCPSRGNIDCKSGSG